MRKRINISRRGFLFYGLFSLLLGGIGGIFLEKGNSEENLKNSLENSILSVTPNNAELNLGSQTFSLYRFPEHTDDYPQTYMGEEAYRKFMIQEAISKSQGFEFLEEHGNQEISAWGENIPPEERHYQAP